MDKTMVRLSAEPTRTRMLITHGARDIGKAMLPPVSVHDDEEEPASADELLSRLAAEDEGEMGALDQDD